MNELMELYSEVFITAWKETHTEGEPPCFEEWKDNDFYDWLENYADNKSDEWQAMLISNYAQEVITYISPCYDIDTLNYYDFTEIYNNIDHDNFNICHDVYWETGGGYIRSGNYCDYVDKYWTDYKEEILDYVINHFDIFVDNGVIDPNEYEY